MQEDSFSDREVEYLLSLLESYAEKLRARSETWYRLHTQAQIVLLLGATLTALVGVYGLWLSLTGTMSIGFILGFVAILLVSTFLMRLQIMRRAKLEADHVGRLRGVMEKLVRRGSQMEDHGSMALTHRIAFDLRLTEAEAALKQAAAPARYSDYHDASDVPYNASGIQFLPRETHDRERSVVSFPALVDGKPIDCAISIEALMDHFGADYRDPMPAFRANRKRIEQLTAKRITYGRFESDGTVLIRNRDIEAVSS